MGFLATADGPLLRIYNKMEDFWKQNMTARERTVEVFSFVVKERVYGGRPSLTLLEPEELGELEVGRGEIAETEAAGEEQSRQPPDHRVRQEVPLQGRQRRPDRRLVWHPNDRLHVPTLARWAHHLIRHLPTPRPWRKTPATLRTRAIIILTEQLPLTLPNYMM